MEWNLLFPQSLITSFSRRYFLHAVIPFYFFAVILFYFFAVIPAKAGTHFQQMRHAKNSLCAEAIFFCKERTPQWTPS